MLLRLVDISHHNVGTLKGGVKTWLFLRARIREGGKPEACSDDANAHP